MRNGGGETVAVISINAETVVARRSRQGAQRLGKFGSLGRMRAARGWRAARCRAPSRRRAGSRASRDGTGHRAVGPGCTRSGTRAWWLRAAGCLAWPWGEKRGRREIGNQRRERENRGERRVVEAAAAALARECARAVLVLGFGAWAPSGLAGCSICLFFFFSNSEMII